MPYAIGQLSIRFGSTLKLFHCLGKKGPKMMILVDVKKQETICFSHNNIKHIFCQSSWLYRIIKQKHNLFCFYINRYIFFPSCPAATKARLFKGQHSWICFLVLLPRSRLHSTPTNRGNGCCIFWNKRYWLWAKTVYYYLRTRRMSLRIGIVNENYFEERTTLRGRNTSRNNEKKVREMLCKIRLITSEEFKGS